jgi:hypothetical protein
MLPVSLGCPFLIHGTQNINTHNRKTQKNKKMSNTDSPKTGKSLDRDRGKKTYT